MRFVQDRPLPAWAYQFYAYSPDDGAGDLASVLDWCRTNFGSPFGSSSDEWIVEATWDWAYDFPNYRFVFRDDVEATAFRLRWC